MLYTKSKLLKVFNMNMWRDNLRECLMQCGVQGKPTTFLFCDTQIIEEQMLEDINNILNSGDVPGLYKPENMEDINEIGKTECLRKDLPLSKMNMFSCYLARVKSNIHVVLAMSPLGEVFRTRLRKFPSLVNCCTIDWFTNWPEEALLDVARGALQDNELGIEKFFDGVTEMFKIIHQSVEKISVRYLDELRRHNYVTPTSYLELLSCYQSILKERTDYFGGQKSRLEKGLNVLAEAAVEIANLREMLDKKQPELEATKVEVAKTKETIAKESEAAEETRVVVAADEAEAAVQESEVSAINKSAQDELAVAEPALIEATKQLKALDVNDFYELKAMGVPTPTVVKMFEITCQMMRKPKPKKPNDPKKAESDPDGYFDLAKKTLLNNPKEFLNQMLIYDKDNIPDALISKVKPLMEKDEVKIDKVRGASKALAPVHIWCNAMITYHETLKIVNPKRELAREMGEKLEKVRAKLAEKRAVLKAVNDKIAHLEEEFKRMIQKEKDLNQEITDCKKKLERAEKLISGLEGEKVRWIETVKQLGERKDLLVGDCLIAAGMVSYSGPFTMDFRQELEHMWNENIERLKINHTPNIRMSKVIGDDVTIRIWNVAGLPNDDLSVENGIIMFKSRRWPLMIDPQTQAKKFIKNLGKDREPPIEAFKPSEPNILRGLELAIQFGKWILLENVGEELDPALEPILLQQKIKTGSSYTIKIGDKTITYNDDFKFFMTTTIPNPHYSPETSVKVTILNFAITPKGLEEQMLNQLVQLEMPELQEKKNQIVEDNARALKELRDIEDKILHGLTKNEQISQILEDDELIIILEASKKTSAEINQRMKESEVTEKEIDEKREGFRSVAYRASLLFFCVTDLSTIDPMYQNSLQWFQSLFENSVNDSQPSNDPVERTQILNDFFTSSLYENVCRGLFEEHKLLFSFLLTVKILFGDNLIDPIEWRYFLAGPSGEIDIVPNPTDWLDELEWVETYKQINGMNELSAFKGIDEYFIEYHKRFKKIFDSQNAHEEPLPGEWNDKLNSFQKMIVLKCIRPDKLVNAIQNFIIEKIGQKFIEPPTFDLKKSYRDSNSNMPLIFILSSGTDPVADFSKFAIEMDMNDRKDTISLGQGMAKRAEKMIKDAQNSGKWCLLANCHLSISWMPSLERIVEQLNDEVHPDFRMWLTSMPSPKFPVSTLQNSVKMTLEPPQGLRANLRRSYTAIDDRELNDCNKPTEFKKLLFGFCFFHAIVQDRRKFGPIGWNIRYGFTNEDLTVCKRQLKIFCDENENIPYKVLNYLGAQINYGGRVTDDKDKRLIETILAQYICPEILNDGYKFSESGIYYSPKVGSQENYLEYITTLPLNPSPEVFGLHENAEITTQQAETRNLLSTILSVQPRSSSSGGKTRDQVLTELAIFIETKTPPPFNLEEVIENYPTEYTESMNTVLTQEVLRYNKLLVIMTESLENFQKALVGEVVMSEDLEKLGNSLFDNLVPIMWEDVGFLSLKPLASWVQDLNDRIKFLTDWIEGGTPAVFWISGFFFPQAFLTGTLQNYARKHIIAINELSYQFKIYDDISPQDVKEKPEDGCYVYGMYLEGARWNPNTHLLDDSRPKQLYTELPMVWFLPKQNRKIPSTGVYNCPVYKVLSRAGTLSTTGHSTNYVLMLELPTKEDESKWIIAGVAAFLSLRY